MTEIGPDGPVGTMVLRGAALIDGTGRDPVPDATISIRGNRVAQVGGRAPAGSTMDLSGLTILPGLIDAHSHLAIVDISSDAVRATSAAEMAARIFNVCRLALEAGFTTVRDAGGADGGLAKAIASGLVPGPRLFPSGPIICQTGGHGDLRQRWDHGTGCGGVPGLYQLATIADGADETRRVAREHFRRGATQLKVCVSGGVVSLHDRVEDAQFSVPELAALVEEAQARDTYVLAHSHNVRGIRMGLAAGVRSFEHASFLDEETASAIAEAGAFVVPTIVAAHLEKVHGLGWGLSPEMIDRSEGVEEGMLRSTKLAFDAGVKVGSGSDLIGDDQGHRGMELTLKARVLGPMAALESATRVNAELMQLDHELGTVGVGRLADLVAIEGDPLSDPELFDEPDRVKVVIKEGVVVKDVR